VTVDRPSFYLFSPPLSSSPPSLSPSTVGSAPPRTFTTRAATKCFRESPLKILAKEHKHCQTGKKDDFLQILEEKSKIGNEAYKKETLYVEKTCFQARNCCGGQSLPTRSI